MILPTGEEIPASLVLDDPMHPIKEVAVETAKKAPLTLSRRGLQFADFDALYRFAVCVSQSGLAPKGMASPQAIAVAIEMGLELGLSPMQALQNIAVINGRPGVFGDAGKALCEASGLMEDFQEWIEGEGTTKKAVCISKRIGRKELRSEFSVADAMRAKLWGREGPWTFYPDRMLMFRARGFNLRDNFGDVLKGLLTTEELQDLSVETTTVSEAKGIGGLKERLLVGKKNEAASETLQKDVRAGTEEVPVETLP